METESPEQAGASWVRQRGLEGRVARLHLPAVPGAALCQGGGGGGKWGAGSGVGDGELAAAREVFAALLGLLEIELSMGAGIAPRSRDGLFLKTQGALSKWLQKGLF